MGEDMTAERCPACGQAGNVYRWDFFEPHISWFKCPSCSSEFLVPQPSDERLAEIYSPAYYEPWKREAEIIVQQSKRRTFLRALAHVSIGASTRLLDVGCAQGEFAAAAVELGGQVAGVDLNARAIEVARTQVPNATFYCGELSPQIVGPGWDIITMFDFIEHVRDPVATLKAAASVLSSSGRLLISTPCVGSVAHKVLGSRWPQYREEHLVLFSQRGLEAALNQAGLSTENAVSTVKYTTLAYLWGQAEAYSSPRMKRLALRTQPVLKLPPTHWEIPLRFGEITITAHLV
jgi:2-polyprenyl-3-methyl-5-hydroxy-6-metoxy-1,4-benzoquinol methylase